MVTGADVGYPQGPQHTGADNSSGPAELLPKHHFGPPPQMWEESAGVAYISLGQTQYEIRPYLTAPNSAAKGIVPHYDKQEMIMRSLEHNDPQVLHARRLGNTSGIIVLLEAVPRYIKYRDTIMRCLLNEKKIQVCDTCLRTGHREDVCPTPNVKCHNCGAEDPLDGHPSTAKCAACGGPHETRSNACRRRFAVPPIVRQRRQQSRPRQQSQNQPLPRAPSYWYHRWPPSAAVSLSVRIEDAIQTMEVQVVFQIESPDSGATH
ncbi:hypothetical protein MTO96_008185 [Rhipicephalus appendiculatus]